MISVLKRSNFIFRWPEFIKNYCKEAVLFSLNNSPFSLLISDPKLLMHVTTSSFAWSPGLLGKEEAFEKIICKTRDCDVTSTNFPRASWHSLLLSFLPNDIRFRRSLLCSSVFLNWFFWWIFCTNQGKGHKKAQSSFFDAKLEATPQFSSRVLGYQVAGLLFELGQSFLRFIRKQRQNGELLSEKWFTLHFIEPIFVDRFRFLEGKHLWSFRSVLVINFFRQSGKVTLNIKVAENVLRL